jgi:hypothetical protein
LRENILMAETPIAITPPYIVGSEWYLDMLFSFLSCTLSLEGSSISVSIWEISQEETFWESTLLDSLSRQPFSPSSTIGSGYNWDMLFDLMLSRFWTMEIINKHFKPKLCFFHSKSASFRSVQLNPSFWKFHRWMEFIFGYIILIIITYNMTVLIVWNIISLWFMVDCNGCQNRFCVNWNNFKIKRKLSIRET